MPDVFLRSGFASALRLEGTDAADFLHRLTSQNIKALAEGGAAYAALLNRQAHVRALFLLWRTGPERFLLVAEPPQMEASARLLEEMRFREKITIAREEALEAAQIIGAGAEAFLAGHPALPRWRDPLYAEPPVHWLLAERSVLAALAESCPALPAGAWEIFRLAQGVPSMEKDLRPDTIALEANMEFALARNKGCYPGQEIVERIYAKGNVARLLVGLDIPGEAAIAPGAKVFDGEKECGEVTSCTFDPAEGRALALAYVQRGHWESGALGVETADGRRLPAALLPNRYSKLG